MPASARQRREPDPVVDKVQKLLRLAHNPNPHEGARAREKAQELIDRYHLTPDGRARRFGKFVEHDPGVRWVYNVADRRLSEEPID